MSPRTASLLTALLLLTTACGERPGGYELVESVPVETSLDDPSIRNTAEVWLEMITGAERTLDIEQFYVANRTGSALDGVLLEVERAAARGVRVRVVADRGFANKYPGSLARLDSTDGIEVRTLSMPHGGTQHAKFFVVDGEEVFVGSQNFDWRSLEHIGELGVRMRSTHIADAFTAVFETDWQAAAGAASDARSPRVFPVLLRQMDGKESVQATPVFSPEQTTVFNPEPELPPGAINDGTQILKMLGEARSTVRVQLLSFASGDWRVLENALTGAADRGVDVRLLVSNWNLSGKRQEDLKRLQRHPGVSVRFTAIPEYSGGFISFARVEHCKYLVVDGRRTWIGTSNWSESYFLTSRNAGVLLDGRAAAEAVERKFDRSWSGPYAADIDPDRRYEKPIIDTGDGK